MTLKLMRRMVIVGTGTDAGKTYVATQLARLYRSLGGACLALKPIESGVDSALAGARHLAHSAQPLSGDARALFEAASAGAAPLYGFRDPISPHLAARREQRSIELPAVLAYVEEQERRFLQDQTASQNAALRDAKAQSHAVQDHLLPALPPLCLIESAGGLFSPLSDELSNWDLARALGPDDLVLVAPDCLGVLHDIQATLRAIAPELPQMLVMSEARQVDSSTGTNLTEVERVVLGQLGLRGKVPCVLCPRNGALPKSTFERLGWDNAINHEPQLT